MRIFSRAEHLIIAASDIWMFEPSSAVLVGQKSLRQVQEDEDGQALLGSTRHKSFLKTEMLSARFTGDELKYSLKKPFSFF